MKNPREFEAGERVFDSQKGWGWVEEANSYLSVPLDKGGKRVYYKDGRYHGEDSCRSLYHADEIVDGKLTIQVEPKKVKWWVFVYEDNHIMVFNTKDEAEKARGNISTASEIKEIEFEVEGEKS